MAVPKSIGRVVALLAVAAAAFAAVTGSAAAGPPRAGAVYTLSNAAAGNAVLAYDRAADGFLTAAGSFATGGTGTGGGLGNQGAVVLSDNGRFVFAVNAGSGDISALAVRPAGLELADKVPSGGTQPISLSVHGKLLYVLNAGSPANITGFRVRHDGTLEQLAGSSQPLSGPAVGPAEVAFSPDGDTLVVTEKGTNQIDLFRVGKNGLAEAPTTHASLGMTPFGFDFDKRGNLIVSEAFGGTASALSSYAITDTGLSTISASVAATGQRAACWVVVSKNGRYAYTTNTATGTVSAYSIDRNGSLALLDAAAAIVGGSLIDASISGDGRFLYVLNGAMHRIDAFAIDRDGTLTPVAGGASGLVAGTNGLAAS
jgi:6-phosphogluconolactonase (cycloisomerase 2 family)